MTRRTFTSNSMIEIKGSLSRHEIVKQVVNTFIDMEHDKKGKGIKFEYPVENLPGGGQLFISRPGHKKNFDFEVKVPQNIGLGRGTHIEIAIDLKEKKLNNPQGFKDLLETIIKIYDCSENDIDKILSENPNLKYSFKTGANVEVILKVIKWLFIMEDIIYWDNEGRAFLFNFFRYALEVEETDSNKLKEKLEKVKNNPDKLKSSMKQCNIEWRPSKG